MSTADSAVAASVAHPVVPPNEREVAVSKGIQRGLIVLAMAAAIGAGSVAAMKIGTAENYLSAVVMALAAAGLLLGTAWTVRARLLDEENYMIEKAPPMPTRLVNEHDDAWIEGELRCISPETVPGLGTPAAYYRYHLRQWLLRPLPVFYVLRGESQFARALVIDEGHEIEIDLNRARLDHLVAQKQFDEHDDRMQHVAEFLPYHGRVSVCGYVSTMAPRFKPPEPLNIFHPLADPRGKKRRSTIGKMSPTLRREVKALRESAATASFKDDKHADPDGPGALALAVDGDDDDAGQAVKLEFADEGVPEMPERRYFPLEPADGGRSLVRKRWRLRAEGHMPMMVTPLTRQEWVDMAEALETRLRAGGAVLLWVGLMAGTWSLAILAGWWQVFSVAGMVASVGIGTLWAVPMLALMTVNRLVAYRIRVSNAWAHIDADLKMRRDLIPALVEIVKEFAPYESELLAGVAQLRTLAKSDMRSPTDMINREQHAEICSSKLAVLVEETPKLQGNPLFRKLVREWTAVEEKIEWGRKFFNETVREYNTFREQFPNSLFAGLLGFTSLPYWRDPARRVQRRK